MTMNDVLHTINGHQVESLAGAWLENIEPATGLNSGRIASGNSDDVDRAVQAAEAAHAQWVDCGPKERSDCLHRLADAVEAELEDLARLETIDNGKPLALSRSMDIPRAVANILRRSGTCRSERGIHHGRCSSEYRCP